MATNPYSYGSLGQRWTVGEPTSKSLLDVSRVKADANRWALEQLIVDPDDTANFVLTAPGLNIDSNTLYVDGVNNSVGFGLTNPNDYAFSGTPSWVASGGAGNASVIVVSGTTSIGYLAFADGTTGTDRYSGNIQYNHSTNTMSFRTNGGVEAMTINSAQDLAVGTDKLYVDVSASAVGVGTSSPASLSNYSLITASDTSGGGLVCQYNGTSKLAVYSANNDAYYDAAVQHIFRTGGVFSGSTAMTIDSSQRVGIGTSSPTRLLSLYSNSPTSVFQSFTNSSTGNTASDGAQIGIDSNNDLQIGQLESGKLIEFYNNGSLAMVIDSSQRIGIGVDSPQCRTHIRESTLSGFTPDSNTNLAVEENSTSMIEIAGTDSGILFSDASAWAGRIFYTHSTDQMAFATAQSNKMTLDSSGNLTLQTNQAADTALAIYNTSSSASAKASLKVGYDSGNHLHIHRVGNDASIVYNSTQSGSDHQFQVAGSMLATLDADGLKFGSSTATANALDDYEEGTWSPTIIATTTNPTVGYSVQYGRYTKIGNIVTVQLKIDLSSFSGGSGGINIGGFPFTSRNDSNYRSAGSVSFARNVTNGGGAIMLNLGPNVNRVSLIKYTNADNYDTNVAPSDLASNSIIHATMTYEAQ